MKAVIIEDEARSREVLKNLLSSYCPQVDVLGMGDSVTSGIEAISTLNPDVVFLDVQLGSGTGFEVLEGLPNLNAAVIFTTAYDHYALKAFKFSAIDYLLKPIDIEELRSAVMKATQVHHERSFQRQIRNLLAHFHNPEDEPVLLISIPDAMQEVRVNEIISCEAEGDHTRVHLQDFKSIVVDKPIKEVEYLLQDYGFFRVHSAHIVNINEVKRVSRGGLIMRNGAEVPISPSRESAFQEARSAN